MKYKQILTVLAATLTICGSTVWAFDHLNETFDQAVKKAFGEQQINLSSNQIAKIRENVKLAVDTACRFPQGNSKVGFASVEISSQLHLDPQLDTSVVNRIRSAIAQIASDSANCQEVRPIANQSWEDYFNKTMGLNNDDKFLSLVGKKQFSPVKISWEDIGRYENSVWGDRISDVGIWVRKQENDPASAELALSVRRDNNFRDKVLVVPAEKIKVHANVGGRTLEETLPERLKKLGLTSQTKDDVVIVSNQFAIVPVPSHRMTGASKVGKPPRAAFNFSIYPYGSTNFVITDVIEGSSHAVIGPGTHQLLFANIDGQKAPFTASRAEDRQDLLALEADLKAKGMDVDVQRYYLIQIPLKREAKSIQLSNMGTPPMERFYVGSMYPESSSELDAEPSPVADGISAYSLQKSLPKREAPGLTKVAIGHGEAEGLYNEGSGYRHMRSEEPVRVTVVYFVTPKGDITQKDMEAFTKAFESWDRQAIWGGSFVVKDDISIN